MNPPHDPVLVPHVVLADIAGLLAALAKLSADNAGPHGPLTQRLQALQKAAAHPSAKAPNDGGPCGDGWYEALAVGLGGKDLAGQAIQARLQRIEELINDRDRKRGHWWRRG